MNLNQITIGVSNLEKSILFYEQLDLWLIVKSPHYARFECPEGAATFSLHEVETVIASAETWIYFEVGNVDEKVAELARCGLVIDEMPNDESWLWRESRIKDPDKNQLIIYTAGENRKNLPWRI